MNKPAALMMSLLWGASAAIAAQSGAAPAATIEDALKVDRTLQAMADLHASGEGGARTYILRERELNAYLARQLLARKAPGVESLRVRILEDSFVTLIGVDMDQLDVGDGVASLFSALLSGRQNLEVEGELRTAAGRGTYRVTRASLNGVYVPATLVNSILSSLGARQEPPFDPTQPFDLAYGIDTIAMAPQTVTIRTR